MMKLTKFKRSAFTMLEVVFVILILGIVASLGAEIIARVYSSYILQRAQYRASVKTELAALEIANRLRYAIPGTVVRRQSTSSPVSQAEELSSPMNYSADSYNVLQWVAYDGDSFEALDPASSTGRLPGWSGFCDLDASSRDTVKTPGSRLGFTDTIIQNLSKNSAGASTKSIADAVLFFPYDLTAYGIAGGAGDTISLDSNITGSGVGLVEQYKLAWTSYALVVEGNDLYLYYNFSPAYAAADINSTSTSKSLLLKNITNFKFQGSGRTIRFKICKEEPITADANVSACKEKAVF
ncbi:MAG: hypothetical protein P794_01235 [Epsilonproteobacteria bacterium (ex Lamellibrachia satsuma)]|nr:MAG: hypothetical protein P794_01235 [Epsilonproteobacteria bacterium (ex Lamellibrachia satsuma)]